jgi:hypothetical protein
MAGSLEDLEAGLDVMKKRKISCRLPGIEPRIVHIRGEQTTCRGLHLTRGFILFGPPTRYQPFESTVHFL